MHLPTRLGRWYYEEQGPRDAPPVVLLHGLLFDGRMWESCVPALAVDHRVVVLDGPGHGRSEVPPPFTLEAHADAVVDALDVLAIQRATIIGLSWGAMTALRMALAHPNRVSGLALLGGSAEVESLRDATLGGVGARFAASLPLPAAFARAVLLPRILSPHTLRTAPTLAADVIRTMQSQPGAGVARAASAVARRSRCLVDSLPYVRSRTLVMCGEDDITTPVARSRVLANGIREAQLSVLDRCGHMLPLERPDEVREAIVGFCRRFL